MLSFPALSPSDTGLEWSDGIGTLQGSRLKFRINEFGLLELVQIEATSNKGITEEDQSSSLCNASDVLLSLEQPECSNHALRNTDPLFPRVPLRFVHQFKPAMKLEAADPKHPDVWSVVSITKVKGHRLKLHFDGYSAAYDFWTDAYSPLIRHIGFCSETGRTLLPPRGFDSSSFDWPGYLAMTSCQAAPSDIFYKVPRAKFPLSRYCIEKGMRLLAEKPGSLDCVKYVMEIADLLDDRYMLLLPVPDVAQGEPPVFWAELDSPFIHPLETDCAPSAAVEDSNTKNDVVTNGCSPRSPVFDIHLPVPKIAFHPRTPLGFNVGIGVEIVDPDQPSRIRCGLIIDVISHRLIIEVPGYPDLVVPENSWGIYPEEFCRRTGYPMSISSKGRVKQREHIVNRNLPDRLTGQKVRSASERGNAAALSSEYNVAGDVQPNNYRKRKRKKRFNLTMPSRKTRNQTNAADAANSVDAPPLALSNHLTVETFVDEISIESAPGTPPSVQVPCTSTNVESEADQEDNSTPLVDSTEMAPSWQRTLLPPAIVRQVRAWSVQKVCDFVCALPGCSGEHGYVFKEQEIDGEAFLLLSQSDLVELLRLKLGPAVKIYSTVEYCRQALCSGVSEL